MLKLFNIFKRKKEQPSMGWEEVKDIVEPFKKTAWFPKVKDGDGDAYSSKFSGLPVLRQNENWPCCKHCGKPMQLFLQLSSLSLPKEADSPFGNGILQAFYCVNSDDLCEVECEAYFPFAKSTLVRVLNPELEKIQGTDSNPVKDAFPEKEIVGWEIKDDFPHYEELEELGCPVTDQLSDVLCELEYPAGKDKLLGWPLWIQGIEYPDCPDCGKRMKYIFQIDSEDNLPFMFGDMGCSHITQCTDHKNQLAIAWACS